MRVESMIKPAILSLGCLISVCTYPQSVGVYTEMSTHRVCCCNTVGLIANSATFNAQAPIFEKYYEGKARVIQVTNRETLLSCSAVFFGLIAPANANSTAATTNNFASLYPDASYDNPWLGTGSEAGLISLMTEYVSTFGGKVIGIGDSVGYTGTTLCVANGGTSRGIFIQSEIDKFNKTFNACRNGQSVGLLQMTKDIDECTCTTQAVSPPCVCGSTEILRYVVRKVSVPSGDPDGDIFKSSEEFTECWLSAFGVGNSTGGISLVDPINVISINKGSNTCSNTNVPVQPFAYEKYGKGYLVFLGDVNMFGWGRSASLRPGSLNLCSGLGLFPVGASCFSGANVNYAGQDVYEVNKYFLWTLLKECPTCG